MTKPRKSRIDTTCEIVMINNTTVIVPKEVAEEIWKLRRAVMMARTFLERAPETQPDKAGGVF